MLMDASVVIGGLAAAHPSGIDGGVELLNVLTMEKYRSHCAMRQPGHVAKRIGWWMSSQSANVCRHHADDAGVGKVAASAASFASCPSFGSSACRCQSGTKFAWGKPSSVPPFR